MFCVCFQTSGVVTLEQPVFFSGAEFGHFQGDSQPASANQSLVETVTSDANSKGNERGALDDSSDGE